MSNRWDYHREKDSFIKDIQYEPSGVLYEFSLYDKQLSHSLPSAVIFTSYYTMDRILDKLNETS